MLGEHKALVGDATNNGDVMTDLVFTDPPYNVDYEGYT
jgi:DNA modification methylase